jgi:hypothetical protein
MRLKDVTIARTRICQQTKQLKPVQACATCPNQCPKQTQVVTTQSKKPRTKKRITPAEFDAAFLRALRISWNNDERSEGAQAD